MHAKTIFFLSHRVVNEARRRFRIFMVNKDMTAIPPDLRFPVFEIVLRTTVGIEEYEAVVNYYRDTYLPGEKVVALTVLGYGNSLELIRRTLAFAISADVRTQDVLTALSTLRSSVEGRAELWNFMRLHWDILYERHCDDIRFLDYFVLISVGSFSSLERYREVQEFFANKDQSSYDRILANSLEGIRMHILWLERDRQDVENWLRKNGYLVDEQDYGQAQRGQGSVSSLPESFPSSGSNGASPSSAIFTSSLNSSPAVTALTSPVEDDDFCVEDMCISQQQRQQQQHHNGNLMVALDALGRSRSSSFEEGPSFSQGTHSPTATQASIGTFLTTGSLQSRSQGHSSASSTSTSPGGSPALPLYYYQPEEHHNLIPQQHFCGHRHGQGQSLEEQHQFYNQMQYQSQPHQPQFHVQSFPEESQVNSRTPAIGKGTVLPSGGHTLEGGMELLRVSED